MDQYAILYLFVPLLLFAYGAMTVLNSYRSETKKISEGMESGKYRPEAAKGKVMMLVMHMATPLVLMFMAYLITVLNDGPTPLGLDSLLVVGGVATINILCQTPIAARAAGEVTYIPNPAILPDEISSMPYSSEKEMKKREYYESIGLRMDAGGFAKRLIQISFFEIPVVLGFLLFFYMLNGMTVSVTGQYVFLILSAIAIPGALKISQLSPANQKDFSRSLMVAALATSPSLVGFLYAFLLSN